MSAKTIMLVGGGSGGHLTPIVAVSESIKQLDSTIRVVHVGQKGEGLNEVTANKAIDASYAITAGKFRRYHGESLFAHLLDVKTLLLNLRDFFRFLYGTLQAWRLLGKVKPESIMLKGGFVCVPVGYAARIRRIPYLTHDSDSIPGLANRLTAKHAVYNTTALPVELYPYDASKTVQVGIPIRKEFTEVLQNDLPKYKKRLGISPETSVIFSVGGGLGAQRVNHALVRASKSVLEQENDCMIIHLTGKKLYSETENMYNQVLTEAQMSKIKIIDFTNELYEYSAAADIVLTRAGATNIAEFAAQAKACIVIPNPVLTGGQQLHNAKILEDAGAAIVVQEDSLHDLDSAILEALSMTVADRQKIGQSLRSLAVYDSADKLAALLNEISN
jgi:UDP-N-acetylglucosamine--N-acetylmuramyl-(pentapeptide) pyrophosphoryl-undecaprenol N-acetylglucosamine transferase